MGIYYLYINMYTMIPPTNPFNTNKITQQTSSKLMVSSRIETVTKKQLLDAFKDISDIDVSSHIDNIEKYIFNNSGEKRQSAEYRKLLREILNKLKNSKNKENKLLLCKYQLSFEDFLTEKCENKNNI